jgi:L-lactate utilization protein LutB
MEPATEPKRKHLIHSKLRKAESFDVEDITLRLKKMRMDSVENISELVEKVLSNLNKIDNVTAVFAEDAVAAADSIFEFAAGTSTFAVSNSSTIKEVLLFLENAQNVNIFDSYKNDLDIKANDDVRQEGQQFFEIAVPEAEYVWNSFLDTTSSAMTMNHDRMTDSDFVGLLGANAISASGSIFFVQHLHNISKILGQADKVVIIAGIHKLVESDEDAAFQARCCGLFGYESLLSEMRSLFKGSITGDPGEEHATQSVRSTLPTQVLVILLDNGRRDILQGEFRELMQCIGCRACTKLCPRANTSSPGYRSAKDILFSTFSNDLEHAMSNGLFNCTLCRGCESQCPTGIPLVNFLSMLREEAKKKGLTPAVHQTLSANIHSHGTPYGVRAKEG